MGVAILIAYVENVVLTSRYNLWLMICLIILSALSEPIFSDTDNLAETEGVSIDSPPSEGNFALPSSQQPAPLMSFGQTLIDRNQLQFAFDTYSPYHFGGAFDNLNATLTYGITDSTALYFNYPIRANPETRGHHASALLDIVLQLEQAVYTTGNSQYQEQATIVGAVTLPTRDATTHRVPRGFGSPTFFWGMTYNRTYVDWLGFVSPGVLLTTSSNNVRLGSQFLYQAGIGRNIFAVSGQSILFGLLEFDGQYTEKEQLLGRDNPNSGGNVISLIPSISFSTKNTMTQVGVGFPIIQALYGNQKKMNYFIEANFAWTI